MLTKSDLKKLNKEQLLEKIEDYGLDDAVEQAKKGDVATNAELADVILAFVEKQAKETEKDKPVKPESKNMLEKYGVKRWRDLPDSVKSELQRHDLLRKECVVIIDNATDSPKRETLTVSWGNDLIGHWTDVIDLENEEGAYVRRGALKRLRAVTFTRIKQIKNKNADNFSKDMIVTRQLKRYNIIPTEGITEKDLPQKIAEQRMKGAMTVNPL